MYKVTEKNGKSTLYTHFESVFYKIYAITGDKRESMKASDACLWLKSDEKYAHSDFIIELA